ncbi:hypothetical protein ACHAW6_011146 [Cyclotella cf. meneghiniana]
MDTKEQVLTPHEHEHDIQDSAIHVDHDHDLDQDAIDAALVDEAIDDSLIPSIPALPPPLESEAEEPPTQNPTILFGRSLKLLDHATFAVLSFDDSAFQSKCSRTSPYYDPTLDPSLLASTLFVQDEVWASKELLFDTLSTFADSVGCKAVKSRDLIRVKSRNPNVKDEEGFYVKLRALHNEKKPAASPKDPTKSVPKARPVWEREVQIREVSCVLPVGMRTAGVKRLADEELCPSTAFANSLKKLDGLSMTIVGFDEKALLEKCCRTLPPDDDDAASLRPNPEFDQRLDMDLMAKELFKRDDVWISRDMLYHALSCFGAVFGFKVVKTRNMLCCKRYGSDNGNRNWSQGPWKVECPFSISLKALHTERRLTENPKDPEKNLGPKCRPIWEREVLIKEANCIHGGGCRPGAERALAAKKSPKAVHPNVTVMKNPGLVNLFTKIRDENTGAAEFVQYSKRIMRLLVEDTVAILPSAPRTINTPTNVRYRGQLSVIDTNPEKVCLVSVIRAGDSLLESFREIFPSCRVGKMWIQRNESSSTKEAIHSCTKLPLGIEDMEAVVLCDPMLATGGSSLTALNTLVNEYGVKPERIVFANVISCPEGLDALAKDYPDVRIVTSWVDECLNDEKFILPGLGDFGDRFFNTV